MSDLRTWLGILKFGDTAVNRINLENIIQDPKLPDYLLKDNKCYNYIFQYLYSNTSLSSFHLCSIWNLAKETSTIEMCASYAAPKTSQDQTNNCVASHSNVKWKNILYRGIWSHCISGWVQKVQKWSSCHLSGAKPVTLIGEPALLRGPLPSSHPSSQEGERPFSWSDIHQSPLKWITHIRKDFQILQCSRGSQDAAENRHGAVNANSPTLHSWAQ